MPPQQLSINAAMPSSQFNNFPLLAAHHQSAQQQPSVTYAVRGPLANKPFAAMVVPKHSTQSSMSRLQKAVVVAGNGGQQPNPSILEPFQQPQKANQQQIAKKQGNKLVCEIVEDLQEQPQDAVNGKETQTQHKQLNEESAVADHLVSNTESTPTKGNGISNKVTGQQVVKNFTPQKNNTLTKRDNKDQKKLPGDITLNELQSEVPFEDPRQPTIYQKQTIQIARPDQFGQQNSVHQTDNQPDQRHQKENHTFAFQQYNQLDQYGDTFRSPPHRSPNTSSQKIATNFLESNNFNTYQSDFHRHTANFCSSEQRGQPLDADQSNTSFRAREAFAKIQLAEEVRGVDQQINLEHLKSSQELQKEYQNLKTQLKALETQAQAQQSKQKSMQIQQFQNKPRQQQLLDDVVSNKSIKTQQSAINMSKPQNNSMIYAQQVTERYSKNQNTSGVLDHIQNLNKNHATTGGKQQKLTPKSTNSILANINRRAAGLLQTPAVATDPIASALTSDNNTSVYKRLGVGFAPNSQQRPGSSALNHISQVRQVRLSARPNGSSSRRLGDDEAIVQGKKDFTCQSSYQGATTAVEKGSILRSPKEDMKSVRSYQLSSRRSPMPSRATALANEVSNDTMSAKNFNLASTDKTRLRNARTFVEKGAIVGQSNAKQQPKQDIQKRHLNKVSNLSHKHNRSVISTSDRLNPSIAAMAVTAGGAGTSSQHTETASELTSQSLILPGGRKPRASAQQLHAMAEMRQRENNTVQTGQIVLARQRSREAYLNMNQCSTGAAKSTQDRLNPSQLSESTSAKGRMSARPQKQRFKQEDSKTERFALAHSESGVNQLTEHLEDHEGGEGRRQGYLIQTSNRFGSSTFDYRNFESAKRKITVDDENNNVTEDEFVEDVLSRSQSEDRDGDDEDDYCQNEEEEREALSALDETQGFQNGVEEDIVYGRTNYNIYGAASQDEKEYDEEDDQLSDDDGECTEECREDCDYASEEGCDEYYDELVDQEHPKYATGDNSRSDQMAEGSESGGLASTEGDYNICGSQQRFPFYNGGGRSGQKNSGTRMQRTGSSKPALNYSAEGETDEVELSDLAVLNSKDPFQKQRINDSQRYSKFSVVQGQQRHRSPYDVKSQYSDRKTQKGGQANYRQSQKQRIMSSKIEKANQKHLLKSKSGNMRKGNVNGANKSQHSQQQQRDFQVDKNIKAQFNVMHNTRKRNQPLKININMTGGSNGQRQANAAQQDTAHSIPSMQNAAPHQQHFHQQQQMLMHGHPGFPMFTQSHPKLPHRNSASSYPNFYPPAPGQDPSQQLHQYILQHSNQQQLLDSITASQQQSFVPGAPSQYHRLHSQQSMALQHQAQQQHQMSQNIQLQQPSSSIYHPVNQQNCHSQQLVASQAGTTGDSSQLTDNNKFNSKSWIKPETSQISSIAACPKASSASIPFEDADITGNSALSQSNQISWLKEGDSNKNNFIEAQNEEDNIKNKVIRSPEIKPPDDEEDMNAIWKRLREHDQQKNTDRQISKMATSLVTNEPSVTQKNVRPSETAQQDDKNRSLKIMDAQKSQEEAKVPLADKNEPEEAVDEEEYLENFVVIAKPFRKQPEAFVIDFESGKVVGKDKESQFSQHQFGKSGGAQAVSPFVNKPVLGAKRQALARQQCPPSISKLSKQNSVNTAAETEKKSQPHMPLGSDFKKVSVEQIQAREERLKRIKDSGLIEIAADSDASGQPQAPIKLADAFAAKRKTRVDNDADALDQDLAVARDTSANTRLPVKAEKVPKTPKELFEIRKAMMKRRPQHPQIPADSVSGGKPMEKQTQFKSSYNDINKKIIHLQQEKLNSSHASDSNEIYHQQNNGQLPQKTKATLNSQRPIASRGTISKEPSAALMERLACGKRPQIDKKEMKKLTKTNYENLPEIKRRKDEERKRQEALEKKERIAKYNKECKARSRAQLKKKRELAAAAATAGNQ